MVPSTQGMFTTAKTPPAIMSRLHQALVRILATSDAKERLFNTGVETVGSTPEQLTTRLKSEIAKWGKVIKDAGIKEQ